MRASTVFVAAAALVAPAFAVQSTLVPVQQIGDGQVQNPATALPPSSGYAPSAPSSGHAAPSSAPSGAPSGAPSSAPSSAPAPPVAIVPSGGGIPPAYGNITQTASKTKTKTATVLKPSSTGAAPSSAPVSASAPAPSAPSAPAATSKASATASKPAVQTGSANTLVGSTVGLGLAALLAAYLG